MTTDRLSESQLEHFRREGYVVIESIFQKSDLTPVDVAISELTELAQAGGHDGSILELEPEAVDGRMVPRRIYNPFDQHQAFRTLATDPRVLDRIESLIGPDFARRPAFDAVVEWTRARSEGGN